MQTLQNTKPLLTEQVISNRLASLAEEIATDYAGMQITVIGVLNGACLFTSDLAKLLPAPLELGFMQISSYNKDNEQTNYVHVIMPPNVEVAGKHVLVVEDILDSGRSIQRIRRLFEGSEVESLKFCVFADKGLSSEKVDYTAFPKLPDKFLIGYGMDSSGLHRNLPGVFSVD